MPSAPLRDLLGAQTKDEDVLVTDMLADLDIGAVECPDRQGAVQRQLHVAGSGSLHSGGRDLLREVGRWDNQFGQTDIVVRQKNYFQEIPDQRIVVDHVGDFVRQLDDQLGTRVTWGCFSRKYLDPWDPVAAGVGEDRTVAGDRVE